MARPKGSKDKAPRKTGREAPPTVFTPETAKAAQILSPPPPPKKPGTLSFKTLIREASEMTADEFAAALADPMTTMGRKMVLRQMQAAAEAGNFNSFATLVDRVEPKETKTTLGNPDGSALFAPRFDTAEGKAKILSSLTCGE